MLEYRMSLLIYRGYLLSFAFMSFNFLNKYISKKVVGIPPYMLVSCRFAIMFLFLLPLFFMPRFKKIMETKNLKLQLLRAIILFSVLLLTYTGYRYLPLSIASSISTSEPIFVVLWSFILRKENLESAIYLIPMVLLGIIGLLLIHSQNLAAMNMSMIEIVGVLSLLLANIICSGGHYLIAKLGQIDPTSTTVAYSILFNNAFMLSMILFSGTLGHSFDISTIKFNIWPILLLGASAWANCWISMETFKYIDPNTNSSIQNLIFPLSILIGYFIEKEQINFLQMIGIGCIFASTFLITYRKFNVNRLDERYELKKSRLMQYIYICYTIVICSLIAHKVLPKPKTKPPHTCKHKHSHDHDHTLCA